MLKYEHVDTPFFVTPHAVDRFLGRIAPWLSQREAIAAVQAALQGPVFRAVNARGSQVVGCRYGGQRFIAVVEWDIEPERWPVVVTVGEWWKWHECKKMWR
jgi:hypothetical protein